MNINKKTIKETIKKILQIMGFKGEIEVAVSDKDLLVVNINTPEGGYLIGSGGETLLALQYLVKLILMKKFPTDNYNFIIDVNNYRKDRTEIIKKLALKKAQQAVREQRKIVFHPMTAYERRIIHLSLAGMQNIICKSEGQGKERHIVIKPLV
ncbi:MAG: R3H domain-containing nucleic acid-binding protein [Candidatus Nanoarchaeia archaeon]